MMDRRNEVEALFEEALECAPEDRTAFLEMLKARAPALHAEVASLLDAHEDAPTFFGRLSDKFVSPLFSRLDEEPQTPGRIGPYQIEQELGRGGMSTVYLARRDDGQFDQRVALKLVRSGVDEAARSERFRSERQILASLNHPNVARLFDGGVTPGGRPYLVMEYVEGEHIDRHCDARTLSLKERLDLFQTVVETVQYAHGNLVVHRDLKPSNILVTEDGQVKLLDFGIAKLLGVDEETPATSATQTGLRWMTPEYAAPEQIKGDRVTTATDVYQLGVLLYHLLTGHGPYRLGQTSTYEIERAVVEEEPTRPSTIVGQVEEVMLGEATVRITPEAVSQMRATELRALQRTLSGDLDAILLKALRKEPEQRYATAEALAADLQRYREGRPVRARRGTWSYRARKYAQRNAWGLAAALVIAALVIGYAATFRVQALQVASERDRAQAEADKAEQVIDLMINLFETTDPSQAQREVFSPREFLSQGVRRVQTDLRDQPAVQAEALSVIGQLYLGLGHFEEAETQLRQAIAIGQTLPDGQGRLARSIRLLGTVRKHLDDYHAADSLYRRALALQQEAFGEEHEDIARTLRHLATLRMDQGRAAETDSLYHQALAMQRDLLGNDHLDVAHTLKNIAVFQEYQGRFEAADSLYRQALALFRRLGGDQHPEVARTLNDLGLLHRDRGNLEEAERRLREALSIKQKVFGEEHPSMGIAYYNLAAVLQDLGHYDDAEPLYRQTLAIDQSIYGEMHSEVAADLTKLASLLHEKGDLLAADSLYRRALTIRRATLPAGRRGLATTLLWYGRLQLDQNRTDEALAKIREAKTIREAVFAQGHWRIAEVEGALGACYTALSRFAEAEPLLTASYEALADNLGATDPRTQRALDDLIALYDAWNKPDQAEAYRVRRGD